MKKIILLAALLVPTLAQAETRWVRGVLASDGTAMTVNTAVYVAGDSVGGLLKFPGIMCSTTKMGRVSAVLIPDAADESAEYNLYLFKSSPAGTFTDHAQFDPTDADLLLALPVINLATTDHFSANDNGISSLSSLNSSAYVASGSTLYGVLTTESTPDYDASTDLAVILGITCD